MEKERSRLLDDVGSARNLSKERTQLWWMEDGKLLGSGKVKARSWNCS